MSTGCPGGRPSTTFQFSGWWIAGRVVSVAELDGAFLVERVEVRDGAHPGRIPLPGLGPPRRPSGRCTGGSGFLKPKAAKGTASTYIGHRRPERIATQDEPGIRAVGPACTARGRSSRWRRCRSWCPRGSFPSYMRPVLARLGAQRADEGDADLAGAGEFHPAARGDQLGVGTGHRPGGRQQEQARSGYRCAVRVASTTSTADASTVKRRTRPSASRSRNRV